MTVFIDKNKMWPQEMIDIRLTNNENKGLVGITETKKGHGNYKEKKCLPECSKKTEIMLITKKKCLSECNTKVNERSKYSSTCISL